MDTELFDLRALPKTLKGHLDREPGRVESRGTHA